MLYATCYKLTLAAMDAGLTLRRLMTLDWRRVNGHLVSKSGSITAASVRFGKVQRYNMVMWGWHLSAPPLQRRLYAASSQQTGRASERASQWQRRRGVSLVREIDACL